MFILLVDNNWFYASVIKKMLLNAGFNRIEYLDNGTEGMQQVNRGEVPDVIIIDENQCFVNNTDIIKNIHSSRPDLSIIVLTSSEPANSTTGKPGNEFVIYMTKDSVSADNLPQTLYDIFTEKINVKRKTSLPRAFSLFRKSFACTLNF